jgi:hypothetical protein
MLVAAVGRVGVNRTVVRLSIVTLGIGIAAYYFWRIHGGGIHLLRGD